MTTSIHTVHVVSQGGFRVVPVSQDGLYYHPVVFTSRAAADAVADGVNGLLEEGYVPRVLAGESLLAKTISEDRDIRVVDYRSIEFPNAFRFVVIHPDRQFDQTFRNVDDALAFAASAT